MATAADGQVRLQTDTGIAAGPCPCRDCWIRAAEAAAGVRIMTAARSVLSAPVPRIKVRSPIFAVEIIDVYA